MLRQVSRRRFLQAGAVFGLNAASGAVLPSALQGIASRHAKKISLLEDGGFTGSAWGWQFTGGAVLAKGAGRSGLGAVHVQSEWGDYARFLVLGPVVGSMYTLSGWVRGDGIVASEDGAGAYFAASQFEFQGRPTEFTVDGKQATEIRYGNYVGTTGGWRRFTQSVKCLPTTAWFEVVVGIYRASGQAWFSGLTFVEGSEEAELDGTMTPREAAALAHRESVRRVGRMRPRAAILAEAGLPVKGAATDPERLAMLLGKTHDVAMVSAAQMADPAQLNRDHFDLLVLGYGETFPLPAKEAMLAFLADGGDLFTTGGYAFQAPVVEQAGQWRFVSETLKQEVGARNLLPAFSDANWKMTSNSTCSVAEGVARVALPQLVRLQEARWWFDLPAAGDAKQFVFSANWRVTGVQAAPDGVASIGVRAVGQKRAAVVRGSSNLWRGGWDDGVDAGVEAVLSGSRLCDAEGANFSEACFRIGGSYGSSVGGAARAGEDQYSLWLAGGLAGGFKQTARVV